MTLHINHLEWRQDGPWPSKWSQNWPFYRFSWRNQSIMRDHSLQIASNERLEFLEYSDMCWTGVRQKLSLLCSFLWRHFFSDFTKCQNSLFHSPITTRLCLLKWLQVSQKWRYPWSEGTSRFLRHRGFRISPIWLCQLFKKLRKCISLHVRP